MLVLFIETTLPKTLLALVNTQTNEVWERWHSSPRASNNLHNNLAEILSESGQKIENIEQTVVVRGPGSFTGARVGFALAQGLKSALGTPIKAVNTLQALAVSAKEKNVCVLIDTLGKEVYTQNFKNGEPTSQPDCLLPTDITIPKNYTCIGNGVEKSGMGRNTPTDIHTLKIVNFAQNSTQPITPLYLKPLNYKKIQ